MIYISITTYPERIEYFINFYNNIIQFNSNIKIILNVYKYSIRGKHLIIPDNYYNLNNLIIKFWDRDYGPILKFISVFDKMIKEDDIFIYCDDDIKYSKLWFKSLLDSIENYPEGLSAVSLNTGISLFYRFRYIKYLGINSFLRGYGGVGFYKKTVKNLCIDEITGCLKINNDKNLYFSDDLTISYFINKYNINCIKVDLNIENNIEEFKYDRNIADTSISKGIDKTICKNKRRYYNLCNKYSFLGNIFNNLKQENMFKKKIKDIHYLIKHKTNFAFIRFGDGELRSIRDETYLAKNSEWELQKDDLIFIEKIKDSLIYSSHNYIKGILCSCCEEKDHFRKFLTDDLKLTINYENNYTYANIFNNSNYSYFKKNILPLFNTYPIILISNKKANLKGLPFNVKYWFKLDFNAHKKYEMITKKLKKYLLENNIKNHLFLFCGGALSNVLIYELFKIEKDNIYLDLGSILDNYMNLKSTRNYNSLCGWKALSTCKFDKEYNLNIFNISCYSGTKTRYQRFMLKIINLLYNFYKIIISNLCSLFQKIKLIIYLLFI